MKQKVIEFIDYLDSVRLTKGLNWHQLENLAGLQMDTWSQNVRMRKTPTFHRLIAIVIALDHRLELVSDGVCVSTWDKTLSPKEISNSFISIMEAKRVENCCSRQKMEVEIGLGKSVWHRYLKNDIYPNAETVFKVASAFNFDVGIEEQ